MNNYPINTGGLNRLRASAGDELSLLTNLVRTEQIGVKMLLQNMAEILEDDESLLVDIVLLVTDAKRIADSDVTAEDYVLALASVDRSSELRAKSVLVSAINHSADKAGFLALPS